VQVEGDKDDQTDQLRVEHLFLEAEAGHSGLHVKNV
jgi:hypothetical protein